MRERTEPGLAAARCKLALTGTRVIDLVITDLGVFTIGKHGSQGMCLVELADGVCVEEITPKTEASLQIAPGLAALI